MKRAHGLPWWYAGGVLAALFTLFPLYLMVKISVSPPQDIFTPHPSFGLRAVTDDHWKAVLASETLWPPLGVPTIVAGVIFTYVFGSAGYLNELLGRLGVIATPIDWTQGNWLSLGVLVVADLWKVTPLITLILLAGLEAIPESALEAAAVDGASGWRQFWYVTLPLLRPSLTMAVILRAIDAFRIFELPLMLTGKSTPVLGTLAYSEFYEYDNPFTSAAAATLLMGLIAICLMSYLGLVARRDSEVS